MPIFKNPFLKKVNYKDIVSYIGTYKGRACEIPANLKEVKGKVAVIFFDNLERKLIEREEITIISVIKKK